MKKELVKCVGYYLRNPLSKDKTITPPFGRFLLPSFSIKNYFRSPAMQRIFGENGVQNNLAQFDGLIISSLL